VGKESVGKENAVQDCRSSGKRGKGECAFGINQEDAENAEKGRYWEGKCGKGKCGTGLQRWKMRERRVRVRY